MTQVEKLLEYLQKHPKGILNIEYQPKLHILRYSARNADLRRDGYDIRCQKVLQNGKYRGINRYYLHTEATKIPNILQKIFRKRVA